MVKIPGKKFSEDEIRIFLDEVKDPEIPVISVIDLGVIHGVTVSDKGDVKVELTPTFAGCPAIDMMKDDIITTLSGHGIDSVEVKVLYNEPWSSNKISPKGKILLREFGLAPPPAFDGILTLAVLEEAMCPNCGSNNTFMMSPFGPTACRSIHHCKNCLETFERFKPL